MLVWSWRRQSFDDVVEHILQKVDVFDTKRERVIDTVSDVLKPLPIFERLMG